MNFGSLKFSGLVFMISGALHLPAPWLSGQSYMMLMIGAIWMVLGYFLYRATRWLAWPVFLLAAFGIAGALTGVFGPGGWLMWLIVMADLVVALSLFVNIWRRE